MEKHILGVLSFWLLVGLKFSTAQQCDTVNGYMPMGNSCFKFVDGKASRTVAEQTCSSENSRLIALDSASKDQVIRQELSNTKSAQPDWDYYWTSGEEILSNWYWAEDNTVIGPQGCYTIGDSSRRPDEKGLYEMTSFSDASEINPITCHQRCKDWLGEGYAAITQIDIGQGDYKSKCFCARSLQALTLTPRMCNSKCAILKSNNYEYTCGGRGGHFTLIKVDAPTGFGRWVSNQPNNNDNNQRCLSLGYGNSFKWIDEPCSLKMRHVCSFRLNKEECQRYANERLQWFDNPNTPNGVCYFISSQLSNWFEANENCKSTASGGSLISITNSAFYESLVDKVLEKGPLDPNQASGIAHRADFWIGGRQSKLQWRNGANAQTLGYSNFAQNEPRDISGSSCIAVSRHSNPIQYQWDMRECNEQHPFICEKAPTPATPTPETPPTPPTPPTQPPRPTVPIVPTVPTKPSTTTLPFPTKTKTTTVSTTTTAPVITTTTLPPTTTTPATVRTPSTTPKKIKPSPGVTSPATPGSTTTTKDKPTKKPSVPPTGPGTPKTPKTPKPTKPGKDSSTTRSPNALPVGGTIEGMSPGIIAAIVVVSVAVLVALIRLIVYCARRRAEDPGLLTDDERTAKQEKYLANYENAGFDNGEAGSRASKNRDSYMSNGNGYASFGEDNDSKLNSNRGSKLSGNSETGENNRHSDIIYAY